MKIHTVTIVAREEHPNALKQVVINLVVGELARIAADPELAPSEVVSLVEGMMDLTEDNNDFERRYEEARQYLRETHYPYEITFDVEEGEWPGSKTEIVA